RDQAGDGGAARRVGGEGLAEEHPQGDDRGEHPVEPPADGGQRSRDELLGEDVGERQAAVLEGLPPEGVHLVTKGTSVRRAHGGPAWRRWMVANLHPPKEGSLCPCRPWISTCGDLSAIRVSDLCAQGSLGIPSRRDNPATAS